MIFKKLVSTLKSGTLNLHLANMTKCVTEEPKKIPIKETNIHLCIQITFANPSNENIIAKAISELEAENKILRTHDKQQPILISKLENAILLEVVQVNPAYSQHKNMPILLDLLGCGDEIRKRWSFK